MLTFEDATRRTSDNENPTRERYWYFYFIVIKKQYLHTNTANVKLYRRNIDLSPRLRVCTCSLHSTPQHWHVYDLRTKFLMPNSTNSLVIAIKPTANFFFSMFAMLFLILPKYCRKNCVFVPISITVHCFRDLNVRGTAVAAAMQILVHTTFSLIAETSRSHHRIAPKCNN